MVTIKKKISLCILATYSQETNKSVVVLSWGGIHICVCVCVKYTHMYFPPMRKVCREALHLVKPPATVASSQQTLLPVQSSGSVARETGKGRLQECFKLTATFLLQGCIRSLREIH